MVEIIDVREKIEAYPEAVGGMLVSTLVTLEKVRVVQYGKTRHEVEI